MSALAEAAKLPAFVRRDFLVAWSYRFAYVSDWASLALQVLMFALVGRIVDPARLPAVDGHRPTYLEFVVVGIAVASLVQLALHRVAAGLRAEQMLGTLEALLMTPTRAATIQIGTVLYDFVYVPIRSALFLAVAAAVFGLHLHAGGLLPAAFVLVAFVPFVWGLGIAGAGLVLTVRRGSAVTGFAGATLMLLSGAYFPLDVLPGWAEPVASWSPAAIAVDAIRGALLGTRPWHEAAAATPLLALFSALSLAAGVAVFRACLERERRRGSLGLY